MENKLEATLMEKKMETTIMENQMEKKTETTIMENQMENETETEVIMGYIGLPLTATAEKCLLPIVPSTLLTGIIPM